MMTLTVDKDDQGFLDCRVEIINKDGTKDYFGVSGNNTAAIIAELQHYLLVYCN